MATDRILLLAAFAAALAFAGCSRDESAATDGRSEADRVRSEAFERNEAERKRLMTACVEAQKTGDPEKIEAAAKALAENRRNAAEIVREHRNSSSKEKTK